MKKPKLSEEPIVRILNEVEAGAKVVENGGMPLGRIIQRIASRYARDLRYIHLNPVRAHMVASPVEYPWSSHHAYLGRRTELWVTTDYSLALFHQEIACAIAACDRSRIAADEMAAGYSDFLSRSIEFCSVTLPYLFQFERQLQSPLMLQCTLLGRDAQTLVQ